MSKILSYVNFLISRIFSAVPTILKFDKLPTNKFGGFRYHQPMPLTKARSYLVYFAGRCPALCSYELFKFGLSVRTTLECRYYRKTLPLYLGVVADLRGRGGFLALCTGLTCSCARSLNYTLQSVGLPMPCLFRRLNFIAHYFSKIFSHYKSQFYSKQVILAAFHPHS